MDDGASGEVTSGLAEQHAREDLEVVGPQFDGRGGAGDPFGVGFRDEHRRITAESAPLDLDTEHVWMARDDRSYIAEGEHLLGDVGVDVADRVPQQISFSGAQEVLQIQNSSGAMRPTVGHQTVLGPVDLKPSDRGLTV